MNSRRSSWPRLAILIAAISVLPIAGGAPARAQDDWEVVKKSPAQPNAPSPQSAPAAQSAPDKATIACGEQVRPASENYRAIVAQLNGMWGTDFHVYEAIAPEQPHVRRGGCIIYNQRVLEAILKQWMNIDDPGAMRPMIYAVFAHELGHLTHGDLDPAAANIPIRNKELSADQFAGYTLERLGIPRLDPDQVTRYYELTGDDFFGPNVSHGTGAERMAAFDNGWRRAQMGLSEQSDRPSGGLGEP